MKAENGELISGQNSQANSGFNGVFGCPTCNNDTSGLTELTTGISFPKSKYLDSYLYNDDWRNYSLLQLGDVTGETSPFYYMTTVIDKNIMLRKSSWYHSLSDTVVHVSPWIHRGGAMFQGRESDLFSFSNYTGSNYSTVSYRIVISI
ncbi:MAG: hypothetical protein HFH86_02985, partial [Bacilli bacterium]|nr:hypothetical protein [Bacilli bacterium]